MVNLGTLWPRARDTRDADGPDQLALTAALRPGGDGLTAVYQPLIDLRDRRPIGYEGFIRGRQDGRPLVPAVLFAAARASGRLAELDRAALTTIVREAAPWLAHRTLFVHLLPRTLDPERVHELVRACRLLDLEPDELVLEIPAHEPSDATELHAVLAAAREHGTRIALDDATPDRATFSQLRRCRPDLVKVSMSVTHELPGTRKALLQLLRAAEDEGAEMVLEGVETAAQEEVARDLGIHLLQGYRYGRPVPPDELARATDNELPLPVGGPS